MTEQASDVDVRDGGSVVMFTPRTAEAREWVDENVALEGWQWMGGSFAVDHRFAEMLIDGLQEDGFEVVAA